MIVRPAIDGARGRVRRCWSSTLEKFRNENFPDPAADSQCAGEQVRSGDGVKKRFSEGKMRNLSMCRVLVPRYAHSGPESLSEVR